MRIPPQAENTSNKLQDETPLEENTIGNESMTLLNETNVTENTTGESVDEIMECYSDRKTHQGAIKTFSYVTTRFLLPIIGKVPKTH